MDDVKKEQTPNTNNNIDQKKTTQKVIKSVKKETNFLSTGKIRVISSKEDLHQKVTKIQPNTYHLPKMKKYLTSANDNLYQTKQTSLNYNDNKSESNIKTKNNLKNHCSANLISNKKTLVSNKENKTLKKYINKNNNNSNNIKENQEQKCNKNLYKNSFIKAKNYTSMQYVRSPKISRTSNFFTNPVTHNVLNNSNKNGNSSNSNINNKHNILSNHKNKNVGHSNPNLNCSNKDKDNTNMCRSIIIDKNFITKQTSSREKHKFSNSNNRYLNGSNSKSKHKKNVKSKIKKINDSHNSGNSYSTNNKAKLSHNSNNSFKHHINTSNMIINDNSNHLKSNKDDNEEIVLFDANENTDYNKIKEKLRNDYELELELENNINQINYTMGNLSSNDFALCNTNSNLETIYENLMKLCTEKGLTLTKIDVNKYICKKDGDNSIKIEINTKGRTNVLKLYYLNGKEAITKEIIRQIVLRIGF